MAWLSNHRVEKQIHSYEVNEFGLMNNNVSRDEGKVVKALISNIYLVKGIFNINKYCNIYYALISRQYSNILITKLYLPI